MEARELTSERIATQLGMEPSRLAAAARRCGSSYRRFSLEAGTKRRQIHAPRAWLKSLQARIYENVLLPLGTHDSVYSVRGRGVVANARQHLGSDHMVVLDVADCFPSTTHPMVKSAFLRCGFDADVAGLLTRLVTADNALPQGPPTSPAVLNVVLLPLDHEMLDLARGYGAIYTRYMDDLCFSGDCPLISLAEGAEKILKRYGYAVNPRKRRILSPGDCKTVTNIVVTTELNPEPEFLQALADELAKSVSGNHVVDPEVIRGRIAWLEALNPLLARDVRRSWRSAGFGV